MDKEWSRKGLYIFTHYLGNILKPNDIQSRITPIRNLTQETAEIILVKRNENRNQWAQSKQSSRAWSHYH